MFYLGRGLQVIGMGNLVVAFFVGITEEQGMGPEMVLLGIGAVVFMLGWMLERKVG